VTPVEEQRLLVERIRAHWLTGWGSTYNPKRKLALELLQTEDSLAGVVADIESRYGLSPKLVVTGASGEGDCIGFAGLKLLIEREPEQPFLLILGTGWGLTEQVLSQGDYRLEPISGGGDYNHLSVRSAA
jgi:hypothetical protein